MNNASPPSMQPPVWRAVVGALLAAVLILVIAVLPAEYGMDPTGAGAALGLTGLADPPARALAPSEGRIRQAETGFTLEPFESLEYKLFMPEGAGMVFAWQSDGPLEYDFHAEPEDGPEGVAESFDAARAAGRRGVYVAPFGGEHGWYFENRGAVAVRLRLRLFGFAEGAVLYRDGYRNEIELGED